MVSFNKKYGASLWRSTYAFVSALSQNLFKAYIMFSYIGQREA